MRVLHDGVKETITEVRTRYWIVKGRSLVRSVIHHCTTCRKHEGAPFRSPPPPPLPEFRVTQTPAFAHTGVDFAGPLFVRDRSSSSRKVWITHFTCLVTHAVHLDIVSDMLTGTFVCCLKRFMARQGLPYKFLSDNRKTFKSTAKLLKVIFKDKTVEEYLTSRGCQWTFNLARAPWWGGVYERMMQSTKRCLRKMLGRVSLSYKELVTVIVEIEGVINSRPISYISAADREEPLTPSHLIVGCRLLSLPDHLSYVHDTQD